MNHKFISDLQRQLGVIEGAALCANAPVRDVVCDAVMAIDEIVDAYSADDAIPVERLGKWGKLFIPYTGDPRGPVGRMGDRNLEEEVLFWGVIKDVDGGRWVPVQEDVLRELIAKAKGNDQESLRPKGRWESNWYKITCSLCNRSVFLGTTDSFTHKAEKKNFKYCPNCGAKMEG